MRASEGPHARVQGGRRRHGFGAPALAVVAKTRAVQQQSQRNSTPDRFASATAAQGGARRCDRRSDRSAMITTFSAEFALHLSKGSGSIKDTETFGFLRGRASSLSLRGVPSGKH